MTNQISMFRICFFSIKPFFFIRLSTYVSAGTPNINTFVDFSLKINSGTNTDLDFVPEAVIIYIIYNLSMFVSQLFSSCNPLTFGISIFRYPRYEQLNENNLSPKIK